MLDALLTLKKQTTAKNPNNFFIKIITLQLKKMFMGQCDPFLAQVFLICYVSFLHILQEIKKH